MSVVWVAAARVSVASTRSGARWYATRVRLIACSSDACAGLILAAAAGPASASASASVPATLCPTRQSMARISGRDPAASPPSIGGYSCFQQLNVPLPRALRQEDAGQDDESAGDLDGGERLREPTA